MDRINNERDFLAVMGRIDKLMTTAVPGTPEADELERLSKMAEQYENANNEFSLRSGGSSNYTAHDLIRNLKKRR